jgi:hypothetical protein
MDETRGTGDRPGGDDREQWSATPPQPEFGTSGRSRSRLASPLGMLRRLFLVCLAIATAAALYVGLAPKEIGIIPSTPRQDGARRGAFRPADFGFPAPAESAPRILAAAPVEERVEEAGVEPPGREDRDRSADRGRRARQSSERSEGSHDNSRDEGEPGGVEQPVVATPEEAVDVAPEAPPPLDPAAGNDQDTGNGNGGGNGNGNGHGNGNGNGNGNGGGNGNGNGDESSGGGDDEGSGDEGEDEGEGDD